MAILALEAATVRATCVEAGLDPVWDRLVAATGGGDLVQSTRWAAARQRLGFRCLRVTVEDAGGSMVGGCLVYARRLGFRFWAGFIPRGPLLFADGPEMASTVLREVLSTARANGIHFLVVQPPEGGKALERAMDAAGFRPGVPSVAPEATLRLDLRRGEDEIVAGMRADRRRGIRRAQRAGFDVRVERDVAVFHRLHASTASRRGFNAISLENLLAQYEALAPEGLCTMFVARYHGAPVAGFWVTRFAGTVTTKLSGWDAGMTIPPCVNEAVEWATIRWAREQGARSYDLGGFDRRYAELMLAGEALPPDFANSHSHFKAGYGGMPVLFPRARFIFTRRWTDRALGGLAQRLFNAPEVLGFIQRLRNG